MSNRIVKEQIIESASLAAISAFAERLYWRLVVMADDWGWGPCDPAMLLPRAFPRLIGKIVIGDIERGIDELLAGDDPLAELWVLNGKPYIRLTGAADQVGEAIHFTVRAKVSKHPVAKSLDRATRVNTCEQLRAVVRKCKQVRASASRNGNGNGNGNEVNPSAPPAGATGELRAPAPVPPDPPPASPDQGGSPPTDNLTLTSPAPRPKGKPREKAPPNPDVKRLIDHYHAEFIRTRRGGGKPPVIRGAPEAEAAKALLSGRTFADAADLVTKFLEDPPKWNRVEGTVRLEDLPAAASKVLARASPGGNGKAAHSPDGTTVQVPAERPRDEIQTDEAGVRRSVRIWVDAQGRETQRRWGDPVEVDGG